MKLFRFFFPYRYYFIANLEYFDNDILKTAKIPIVISSRKTLINSTIKCIFGYNISNIISNKVDNHLKTYNYKRLDKNHYLKEKKLCELNEIKYLY